MIDFFSSLHPFFVYFTIGLLTTSAILYLVGFVLQKQDSRKAVQNMALWLLWGGAAVTVLAIASGFWAYAEPGPDDPAHLAVKGHRNWAIGTAILFFALAGWTWSFVRKGKMIPFYFPALLFVGAFLIGITGWKGGDLVSSYGDGKTAQAIMHNAPPAEETVDAFHHALKEGNREAALSLLDQNVLIFEGGYAERSREQYAGDHLPGDMAFSKAVSQQVLERKVSVIWPVATVASEVRTSGTYNDRDYNLLGTETMVLKWDGAAWRITHIHWSSHPIGD